MSLPPKEQALADAIGLVLVEEIERACKPLRERIEALERRGFKGVHQRAMTYNVGDEVTMDGSLWIAIAPVAPNELPGKSSNWQLAVKNGHGEDRRSPTMPRTQGFRP